MTNGQGGDAALRAECTASGLEATFGSRCVVLGTLSEAGGRSFGHKSDMWVSTARRKH